MKPLKNIIVFISILLISNFAFSWSCTPNFPTYSDIEKFSSKAECSNACNSTAKYNTCRNELINGGYQTSPPGGKPDEATLSQWCGGCVTACLDRCLYASSYLWK